MGALCERDKKRTVPIWLSIEMMIGRQQFGLAIIQWKGPEGPATEGYPELFPEDQQKFDLQLDPTTTSLSRRIERRRATNTRPLHASRARLLWIG